MAASPIPPSGHIPPAFLQTLVELDKGIADVIASEKNANKKMAAGKSKAVSSMKQALKKKAKEFEILLKTYNEVSISLAKRVKLTDRIPKYTLPHTTKPMSHLSSPRRQRRENHLVLVLSERMMPISKLSVEVDEH
jgi:hypothetical protein